MPNGSRRGQFRQILFKGYGRRCRYIHREADVIRKLAIDNDVRHVFPGVFQRAQKIVGDLDRIAMVGDVRDDRRGAYAFGESSPVRAGQAAGAEFDAAEIASHYGEQIGQVPLLQHMQHGTTCRAGRFAVVIGLLLQSAGGAEAKRRTVMRRIVVAFANGRQRVFGFLRIIDGNQITDKARFFDDRFVMKRFFD